MENNFEGSFIYNVTIKVDHSIAEAWLAWMKNEHLPGMMQTGCFTGFRMARILEVDDAEGPTYTVQYELASKADYNRYLEIHASRMRNLSYQKWGEGFIAFRSLMQLVQ